MLEKVISQPCLRNQEPIYTALTPWLTHTGKLLEVASGTGQHGVYMTARLPHVQWQLSEYSSHTALSQPWLNEANHPNLLPCIKLDISQDHWPVKPNDYTYAYCANLLHFISEEHIHSLFSGIAKVLITGGLFFCYGPINENGFTSEGNVNLDAWLKQDINPKAGIKEVALLQACAQRHGLSFKARLNMPANNVILIFEK